MKKLSAIFVFVLQFIFFLTILEFSSFFYLKYSSNPLYRAMNILTIHPMLGWMQKKNLNTEFESVKVITDKYGNRVSTTEPNDMRPFEFITLGPSSAFGWGVNADETYHHTISQKLGMNGLNASGVGHSIYQGSKNLNELISKPNFLEKIKFVNLAYGINDLDKFRFFDSLTNHDVDYFKNDFVFNKYEQMAYHSAFMTLLLLAKRKYVYQSQCLHLVKIEKRVSWEEFELYITGMANMLMKKNIPIILITTPFLNQNPNPRFKKHEIDLMYSAVELMAQNRKCKEAHDLFSKAKLLEPDNIEFEVNLFNQNLKELAKKNNWPIVDAHRLLSNHKKFFYDPVHPSKDGHEIIATEILKLLPKNN